MSMVGAGSMGLGGTTESGGHAWVMICPVPSLTAVVKPEKEKKQGSPGIIGFGGIVFVVKLSPAFSVGTVIWSMILMRNCPSPIGKS